MPAAHPFARVDIAALDDAFPDLLAQAGQEGDMGGLTRRERLVFRFGLMVGHGEWDMARQALAASGGLPAGAAVRAFAEAAVVLGRPVVDHLGPSLRDLGLGVPPSLPEALAASRSAIRNGPDDLSLREAYALGLGVTWGARCWDT